MATMTQKDIENFNAMVKKFSDSGLSEEASLGVSGLMAQQMRAIKENTKALEKAQQEGSPTGSSPVRPPIYQREKGIDQGTLVDQLRLTTFTVKVENAIGTIVDPIYRRSALLSVEERIFYGRKMDSIRSLQRQAILAQEQGAQENSNLLASISRKYQEFMRFPIWNSLAAVAKGAFTVISTAAFGFKKRKSDADRIVEAISKQTEFMRTGAIDNTANVFQRVFRQGLVGAPLRALGEGILSGVTGISAKRGQERENRRAQGENVTDWRSRMSTLLYMSRLNLRGTRAGAAGGLDEKARESADAQRPIIEKLAELVYHTKSLTSVIRVRMDGIGTEARDRLAQVMFSAAGSTIINHQKTAAGVNEDMYEQVVQMAAGSDISRNDSMGHHRNVMAHQKEEQMFFENMTAANDEMHDNQKEQIKWMKRVREGQVWAQITRMGQLALSGIRTVLGGIAGTLTTIGTTVAALLALSRRRRGLPPGGGIDGDGPNQRRDKPNQRRGSLGRLLDWGKNLLSRQSLARGAQMAGRAAPWAAAAGGGYYAGRLLAPSRPTQEMLEANYGGPAPNTASGPAGGLVLPNDNGAFQREAERADREASQTRDVTARITNQVRESMSLLGDKLDETARAARRNVNMDTLNAATQQAKDSAEARIEAVAQRYDSLSNRVAETAREQMNNHNQRSEEQMTVLETIAETLGKLLRNDEKKMNDGEGAPTFLSTGNFSIFGDN